LDAAPRASADDVYESYAPELPASTFWRLWSGAGRGPGSGRFRWSVRPPVTAGTNGAKAAGPRRRPAGQAGPPALRTAHQ